MPQHKKKPLFAQKLSFIGLLLLGPLGACEPAPVENTAAQLPPADSGCGKNGKLQTSLFGSLETTISWSGSALICQSMRRPNGAGIRLRFSGDIAGEQLAIIIAVPGMRRGEKAVEMPSNVTIIVEGRGRFFSTPGLDSCWTDIDMQSTLPGEPGSFAMTATLYCVTPLGEINGGAAVSIPELTFSTIVRWGQS